MPYETDYNVYWSPNDQRESGQNGPRDNAYQSSTYWHQPQRSVTQNAIASSRSYSHQTDGRVNFSGKQPTDGVQSGFADARSSLDAANLGNQAYGSSLDRIRGSPQQVEVYGVSAYEALDPSPSGSTEHKSVDGRNGTGSSYVTNRSNAASQSSKLAYQSALSDGFPQSLQELNSRPDGRVGQPKSSADPQDRPTADAHSPAQNILMQINTTHQQSNTHAQPNGQSSQQSRPAQDRHPTTIDPSQVFNDFEYQRRKEGKMAKANAAEFALDEQTASSSALKGDGRTEAARSLGITQSSDVLQAASAKVGNSADVDTVTRDQMELEMMQMVEKMRDYRAKDPSLFLQIWENVKKGQSPQASATSSKSPIKALPASLPVKNVQLPSPIQSDILTESEVSAIASFPPDFDRGRFPLQRRRRGGLRYHSTRGIKSPRQRARSSPAEPPEAIPLTTTTPLLPAPFVTQTTSNDADQRSYAAMQTHHQIPNPPIHTTTAPPRQEMLPLPPSRTPAAESTEPKLRKVVPATNVKPDSPTGKAMWPEQHKRALAEAAVKMLTTVPPNVGKQITADELHSLLDQNPSYAQFCAHLDARGFVVDRRYFARALIDVVPFMAGPSFSDAKPPSQSRAPSMSHNRYDKSYGAPRPLTDHEERPLQNSRGAPSGNTMPGAYQVVMSGAISDGSNKIMQPIATKEDKVRKRKFGDFDDLTQFTSDGEDELSERRHPKSRIDQSTNYAIRAPAKMIFNKSSSSIPSYGQAMKQGDSRRASTTREHILKERVVDPLNTRRDARRCSSYDSKTIARDILVSSGKHPTMAPLNYHLEILRKRFECVNYDSDLRTIRWDIVDPVREPGNIISQVGPLGVQAAPKTLADVMNQDSDDELADGKGADMAFPKLAEKETSSKRHGLPGERPNPVDDAYPALSFTSDHVSNRTSSIPDERIKGRLSKDISKPASNRKNTPHITPDLVTPKGRSAPIDNSAFTAVNLTSKTPLKVDIPEQLSSPLPHPARGPCVRCRRQNESCNGKHPCSRCRRAGISSKGCVLIEDETSSNTASSIQPTCSLKRSSSARVATLSSPLHPPVPSTPPSKPKETVHGRIGRPPGAKNKAPRADKGIPRALKNASSSRTAKPVQPPRRADSTPQRASGLRDATSPTDGIAVIIPSRSPSIANSNASHARGRHGRTAEIEEPPIYQSYKCGWQNCPAELHNLETFRKHIHKHCKGLDTPLPCLWTDCTRDVTYKDEKAWNRHVEKKHVRAIARALGDVLSEDSEEDS